MAVTAPPAFLDLAGHPLRWRLLAELAQSDRVVDELVDLVEHPQALVSYHLGRLRSGGLVSSRRSSKDGRAIYYRLDLDRFADALSTTGSLLHPAIDLRMAPPPDLATRDQHEPVRVLFACTGNSARSQIAEALLRSAAGDAVHVVSAGSHPKPVHRRAVEVLASRGIDIAGWRSKPLTDFTGQRFDYVITLCDKVRERCPEFVGDGEALHWSIEDPSPTAGPDSEMSERFEHLATDLDQRIRWLTRMIDRSHLQRRRAS